MGQALTRELLARGHTVAVLARPGSASKVPSGARIVAGHPLDASTFSAQVAPADTLVHLAGVTKPAPWKEREFRAADLLSVQQSIRAAQAAGIHHFVYVSVAQPAPVMQAYIRVRQECEALIEKTGILHTFLRPWYVLGPGRQWPLILVPLYKLMEALGSESAVRLGLVTLPEMIGTLVWAIENPGSRILSVPDIRRIGAQE